MRLIYFRNICIYLFIVSFFFFPRLQTLFIGVAFFITFFTGEFANFKEAVLRNKLSVSIAIYFIITFISLLYTSDMSSGWKGIEIKFSMIAFPIFLPIIFYNSNSINRKTIINVLTITAILYAFLSFSRAFYLYFTLGETINFNSVNLGFRLFQDGPFVHPTYVSIYYVILILLWGKRIVEQGISKRSGLWILMLTFFLVFVFFSSSKAGILLSVLAIFLLLIYYAKKKKKTFQALLMFVLFVIVGVIGVNNSSLKVRFNDAYQEMTKEYKNPVSYVQSTGARIWVWKSTIEVIKENPLLGVGVGDTRYELTKKYKEIGIIDESIIKLDSHQQYLQTTATIGIIGLISLLLIFASLFYYSKKQSHFILFGFTLTYLLFGFTESMFETQGGIIFFTFFSLFLVSKPQSKIENKA
ncbi:O-antigen ligase family protein [Flavobacteriales bacterium]|nr:O-antigen ligase family protein [Flavobacteriales bacterium]